MEKGDKTKKKPAGKVKAKIRIENEVFMNNSSSIYRNLIFFKIIFKDDYNSRANYGVAGAYDEDNYEDFM